MTTDEKHDLSFGSEEFASREEAQARAEKIRLSSGIVPSISEYQGTWTVLYKDLDQDDFADLDEAEKRRVDSRWDREAKEIDLVIRKDHPTKGVYGD